jgi:hypothetical protein
MWWGKRISLPEYRWQGVALITHTFLADRLKKEYSYKFTSLVAFHGFVLDKDI